MSLLDVLFSCRHKNRSFPITDRSSGDTYTCCLECGTEHHYDWATMSRRSRRKQRILSVDSVALARQQRAFHRGTGESPPPPQMAAVSVGG